MPKKNENDKVKALTLEEVVTLSQKDTDFINGIYPKRHGYGLLQEEAKPLLFELARLAYKEDHAQREKIIDRCQRVQVIGRDKLYSLSPEQVLLRKEQMQLIVDRLTEIRKDLSDEEKEIYDEYYLDKLSQKEIAQNLNSSQPQISRVISKINTALATGRCSVEE